MLGIDGCAQGFLFHLWISWAGFASVGRLPPLWADLVATSGHLLHDQAVIGIEAIGRVVKDIVDCRWLLAPNHCLSGRNIPGVGPGAGVEVVWGIKSWCHSLIY